MEKTKKYIFSIIFLLFLSHSTQHSIHAHKRVIIRPHPQTPKTHISPYIQLNIKIIAIVAMQLFRTLTNLQNKHFFATADVRDTKLVKELAKKLGFKQKDIDKLQVKKPVKYTSFDQMFRNNFAAFFRTIIIGRQDHEVLGPIEQEENVKKFTYAHELSHIKYQHSKKLLFYVLFSPIIVYGVTTILSKFLRKEKNLKIIPNILDSFITKSLIQISGLLLMKKKFEKAADMGAASLGPEYTKGGIKFFEAITEVKNTQYNDIANYFDNIIISYLLRFILTTRKFFYRIFDPHPSPEKRVKYLKRVLEKQLNN